MEEAKSLWYGVLYDPSRRRILVAERDLAAQLLVYLLGGIDHDLDRGELRLALARVRNVGGEKTMSFEGKFVKPREVGLPNVL